MREGPDAHRVLDLEAEASRETPGTLLGLRGTALVGVLALLVVVLVTALLWPARAEPGAAPCPAPDTDRTQRLPVSAAL